MDLFDDEDEMMAIQAVVMNGGYNSSDDEGSHLTNGSCFFYVCCKLCNVAYKLLFQMVLERKLCP